MSEANENKEQGQTSAESSDAIDSADQSATPVKGSTTIVRNGGTGTFFLGGMIAAGMGFGASLLPQVTPFIGGKTAALEATIAEQAETITGLQAKIAELSEGPDLSAVSQGLADTESRLNENIDMVRAETRTLTGQYSGLDQRISNVEKRPTGGEFDDAAVQAYEREVTALREEVAAQSADIQGMAGDAAARIASLEAAAQEVSATSAELRAEAYAARAAAEAAAAKASAQSSLTQIASALSGGGGFEAALPGLTGLFEVPAAFQENAADGVLTQAKLEEQLPDAARAALTAARSAGESGEDVGHVEGFFRKQFGVRSTVAQDGTSADAILSRAEAALRDGDLATTLTELDALPDTAKSALSDWTAALSARQGVVAAHADLTQQLSEK